MDERGGQWVSRLIRNPFGTPPSLTTDHRAVSNNPQHPRTLAGGNNSWYGHPAQHDNCFTSLVQVCAASSKPPTIVRYGTNWSAAYCSTEEQLVGKGGVR